MTVVQTTWDDVNAQLTTETRSEPSAEKPLKKKASMEEIVATVQEENDDHMSTKNEVEAGALEDIQLPKEDEIL